MAHRIQEEPEEDDYDLTEEFAREAEAKLLSENSSTLLPEVIQDVTIIKPQPTSVLEKIKSLGNDAVYVLQDLLLDSQVSDKVRLDAVKAVIAIVEAEKNKEINTEVQQSADLDELERL